MDATIAAALISGGVGALGIIGTVVTSVAGSRSQFRTQAMLAADARDKQIADIRRVGCAEYLTAANAFFDQARELVYRMGKHAGPEELKEVHGAYLADWKLLQRTYAPVAIGGPDELTKAADALMNALASLADECDAWHAAYERAPSTRSRGTEIENLRDAVTDARAAFVRMAREKTYPEERPAVSGPTRRLPAVRRWFWQRRKAVED